MKFLANHPSHDVFTPDAMFRLADLYLDQADEEVESRLAATEGSNGQPQAGSAGDAPIVADYSKSLDLWEDILRRFPSYRQTPSTLYLLAYYMGASVLGSAGGWFWRSYKQPTVRATNPYLLMARGVISLV